ncbi:putative metalloprotease CJM1_0395 family protein [Stappia sp.]|uniref:putative metalloprotease CJM1_0395 family protein n=1 Tax=Stappia sp. TaxID=1870903 RepID=UPI0032D946D7
MFAALSPVAPAASAPASAPGSTGAAARSARAEGQSVPGFARAEPGAGAREDARATPPQPTLRAEAVAALQSGDQAANARREERNPQAPAKGALAAGPASGREGADEAGQANAETDAKTDKPSTGAERELTEEQEKQVRELKKRDAEVKQHEQAHASVGGPYAGSPSYQYTRGPDGKRYATSGEVPIDASPEREPEQTLRKMEIVIRAALAPAEPSPQDRQVAAQARQQRSEAQAELQKLRQAEQSGEDGTATGLAARPASARADDATAGDTQDAQDAQEAGDAQARQQATAAVAAYQAAEAAAAALFGSGPAPRAIVA